MVCLSFRWCCRCCCRPWWIIPCICPSAPWSDGWMCSHPSVCSSWARLSGSSIGACGVDVRHVMSSCRFAGHISRLLVVRPSTQTFVARPNLLRAHSLVWEANTREISSTRCGLFSHLPFDTGISARRSSLVVAAAQLLWFWRDLHSYILCEHNLHTVWLRGRCP